MERNKKDIKTYSLLILFLFSFFFFLFSCKNSTSPNTVTLSGTVTLEDTSDYSGVKVMLFKPVELDTALLKLNQEYPNIGVKISQETEFDHRKYIPIYKSITDDQGLWEIKNIEKGNYHLVAELTGFGWRYVYDVEANSSKRMPDITLYKETKISGVLQYNTEFEENHHYVVAGDFSISPELQLTIQPGVWIRFSGLYSFKNYGNLNVIGNKDSYVRFTSNTGQFSSIEWQYLGIFNVNNTTINYAVIENSKSGISINNSSNVKIINSIFRNNAQNGIISNQISGCNFKNLVFRDSEKGHLLQSSEQIESSNSIYYNCGEGLHLLFSDARVKNNLFSKNENGIHSQHKPSSEISNNEFNKNIKGIFCAGSDPLIHFNNFNSNDVGVYIGVEYNSVNSNPIVNQNNIVNNKDYALVLFGHAQGLNTNDIDASQNWWGTTSETGIRSQIFDKDDSGPDSIYVGTVHFKPFLESSHSGAGIQ